MSAANGMKSRHNGNKECQDVCSQTLYRSASVFSLGRPTLIQLAKYIRVRAITPISNDIDLNQ